MNSLTEEERRRLRIAGKVARGLRYFLYLVMAGVVALLAMGLYIYFSAGH